MQPRPKDLRIIPQKLWTLWRGKKRFLPNPGFFLYGSLTSECPRTQYARGFQLRRTMASDSHRVLNSEDRALRCALCVTHPSGYPHKRECFWLALQERFSSMNSSALQTLLFLVKGIILCPFHLEHSFFSWQLQLIALDLFCKPQNPEPNPY